MLRICRHPLLALAVAIVLHLPLTPLALIFAWLRAYLERDTSAWDYADNHVVIPITLLEEPGEPASEPPANPAPTLPAQPGGATPAVADAGATDAADAASDATVDALVVVGALSRSRR